MAQGQDLTLLFRAWQSELYARVATVKLFYFCDIDDARRKQVDETGDAGRMVAGGFAFDDFLDQRDDLLLLRARIAQVRIHRMASMTREAVIVTGAGRGIGAAVARLIGANGFPVVVNYAKNKSAADRVVAEIVAAGGVAIAIQGDVGLERGYSATVRRRRRREFGVIGGW